MQIVHSKFKLFPQCDFKCIFTLFINAKEKVKCVQDRPGGRTGSSGPLQQKYDGVFFPNVEDEHDCHVYLYLHLHFMYFTDPCCSSLWILFHPLQFVIKSVPSMCSLFNLLLSLKKETTLLLMLSVINKLSTLTVSSKPC